MIAAAVTAETSRARIAAWFVCLLVLGGSQAKAAETPQLWLNAGTLSYHFDRGRDFREDNVGFGAELWVTRDHGIMAGTFINSDRVRSRYGAYQWRPLHWKLAGVDIGAGVAAGAFDGYPRYDNGRWFAVVLPVLSIEYRRFGANLFIVPTIRDRLDGAVSLQLKLRAW
ncbi:MAG: hypothetical protein AB7E73_03415 [Burkholderiales bacterium]